MVRRLPGGAGGDSGRGRPGGYGLDFHDYQPFGPGDDLRRVDWRRYERSGDLLLRTDLDRSGHAIQVLIDSSGSMALGDPPKLGFALRVAAAVAFAGISAGHPVGIVAFAGSLGRILPARPGRPWLDHILRFLAETVAAGPTDLAAGLGAALAGARGTGRIVLISDLIDPAGPGAALDFLVGPRRAADVVEVRARGEQELPVGATIDAVDPETGDRRTFTVTPEVAKAYGENLRGLRESVKAGCSARGLVHLACVSGGDPVEVVRVLASTR